MAAIRSDSAAASISAWSCHRTAYQCSENPLMTVVRREGLKLVATSSRTGP
jgi:hypothetical protein